MKKRSGVLRTSLRAGLAAGALMLASTDLAQAQWFGFGYGHRGVFDDVWRPRYRPPVVEELSPREIVEALEDRGFSRVSRPVYEDDVAVVTAIGPGGRSLRLTIDLYSGRIIDREPAPLQRPQVVQRAPDQGPTIRRTVPENTERSRAAPVERAPEIRREPATPPQATPPAPPVQPRNRVVRPERPPAPPKPPEANAAPAPGTGTGTRTQPRRIEIVPPAPLDSPAVQPAPRPTEPPINSVPPAGLE